MGRKKLKNTPEKIFKEYQEGISFKQSLGDSGLFEQNKRNERFLIGDQWKGANCGNDRPLVRHNVIKRIADYKLAVVGSSPVAVNYSAEGIPNTLELKGTIEKARSAISQNMHDVDQLYPEIDDHNIPTNEEINLIMSAMSDYFKVTAERLKFEDLREQALRNAYIAGTGILYTYWEDRIRTGLYSDTNRKSAVKGDINCEILDVENVYFGDPNLDSIQDQPYIIIAQRKSVSELRREAKKNKRSALEIESIMPDNDTGYMAGQISEDEPASSKKATVVTKIWKEWNDSGYTLKAVKVCSKAVIRSEWDVGISLYPFAKFSWERRRNCVYGESEITYLIPNQIAINRMITASTWAVIMMGMPIMIVNQDIVENPDEISNEPGEIIAVNGNTSDVQSAVRYLNPPNFSPNFDSNVESLIRNTLTQSGANDAALGDMRPDNTSAIIAVREAATMPLQQVQNRYYSFCEDVARIWAEFWVTKYGDRSLKIEDDIGTWYMPFKGDRYKDLLISAKIDVGASNLWSESQSIRTLDNLFDRQVIDVVQYLDRLPKGIIPNINKLKKEIQNANMATQGMAPQEDLSEELPQTDLESLDPNTIAALQRALTNTESITPETIPTGVML